MRFHENICEKFDEVQKIYRELFTLKFITFIAFEHNFSIEILRKNRTKWVEWKEMVDISFMEHEVFAMKFCTI